LDTAEGQITILNNNAVPFVQVLTPDLPPANPAGQALAPAPQCGLGFLDALPAPASEVEETRWSGPPGEYTGSVSFYFGH